MSGWAPAEWPDRVDADLVDQDDRALTGRRIMEADGGHAFSGGTGRAPRFFQSQITVVQEADSLEQADEQLGVAFDEAWLAIATWTTMEADGGHAFSGGALSERDEPHTDEARQARRVPSGGESPAPLTTSRSESVTHYEAAPALGGTGQYRVLELPACREVAHYPTLEAAQAYALALNEWLAARPAPEVVRPFFAPGLPERAEPTLAQLEGILARGDRPERMGL